MKKVLVIGEKARIDEFKKLQLQHAEVTYHEFADLTEFANQLDDHGSAYEDDDDDDLDFEDDDDSEPISLFVAPDDDEDDEDEESMESFPTEEYDVIFDLNFDDDPDAIAPYLYNEGQVVFGCTVKRSLAQMVGPWEPDIDCKVFGINAWPTFLDRPKLEISMLDRADHMTLEATLKTLGLEYELIEDQIGMVTPRVVSMIINEAAFVMGEGTADVEAVDQAMKLGTNYPKGPFEWCDQIGVQNVVELLQALAKATGDGKYKIAPALRRQADRDLLFYPER